MRSFAQTTGRLIADFNRMRAKETPAQREARIASIDLGSLDVARDETIKASPDFASIYGRMMLKPSPRRVRRNPTMV